MKPRVTICLTNEALDWVEKMRGEISRSAFIEMLIWGGIRNEERKEVTVGYV